MSKYFKISFDKYPVSYTCGEKIIILISATEDGIPISCEHIKWEIRSDDGKTQKGIGSCTTKKQLVLETDINRAGFIHIICTAVNEKGEKILDFDTLEAGAGADIHLIEYHDIIPDDFDLYWREIEKQIEAWPIEVISKKKVINGVKDGFIAFDVQIKTPFGRPASGFITFPETEGKYPIKLEFIGYSIIGAYLIYEEGTICACFNAHGIENHLLPEEIVEKYEKELGGYGFSNEENASNMTTYFRNMMIRNLVASKYLKTLLWWDKKTLIVRGGSQGALQATTVAAHDDDVTELFVEVPWLCDLNAVNIGYLRGWRPDFAEGLRYFDTVAQATRVKCPVNIVAGLGDYVCPPSSVMALYNSINTEKNMKFIQGKTHSYTPPEILDICIKV